MKRNRGERGRSGRFPVAGRKVQGEFLVCIERSLRLKSNETEEDPSCCKFFSFPLFFFRFHFPFFLSFSSSLPPCLLSLFQRLCPFVCLFVCSFLTISSRQSRSFLRPKSYYVTCRKSAFCKISRAGPFFQREMSVEWIKA